jgi:hypothetical protein
MAMYSSKIIAVINGHCDQQIKEKTLPEDNKSAICIFFYLIKIHKQSLKVMIFVKACKKIFKVDTPPSHISV